MLGIGYRAALVTCLLAANASCFSTPPLMKLHSPKPTGGSAHGPSTPPPPAPTAAGKTSFLSSRRSLLVGGAAALLLRPSAAPAITVAERDALYEKAKAEEATSADATKIPDDTAGKLFRDAQRAQQSGNVEKALVLTNQLVENYPGFAYGWSNRGNLFVAMQQYEKALPDYDRALKLSPSGKESWVMLLNRATTLSLLGRHKEGIKDYDTALQLVGGGAAGLDANDRLAKTQEQILKVNRGLTKCKIADWTGAEKDFKEAKALTPDQTDIWWIQYALVVFEVGGGARDEEALELLTAVNRKIQPTSDSKAALAALSMSKGDRDAAETFWSDVQRTKSFSSKAFLEGEKHWPPRAVAAMAKFRGPRFGE